MYAVKKRNCVSLKEASKKTCDSDWQKYVFFALPSTLPLRPPPTPLAVYMICGSSTNAASGKRNLRNRNRKFSDGQLRCWSRRCHRPSWLPGCLPATQCLLPPACCLPQTDTHLMDARRSLSLSCRILGATFDFDFDFRAQFMHLSAR